MTDRLEHMFRSHAPEILDQKIKEYPQEGWRPILMSTSVTGMGITVYVIFERPVREPKH
jgi:hypothetical protein